MNDINEFNTNSQAKPELNNLSHLNMETLLEDA